MVTLMDIVPNLIFIFSPLTCPYIFPKPNSFAINQRQVVVQSCFPACCRKRLYTFSPNCQPFFYQIIRYSLYWVLDSEFWILKLKFFHFFLEQLFLNAYNTIVSTHRTRKARRPRWRAAAQACPERSRGIYLISKVLIFLRKNECFLFIYVCLRLLYQ